MVSGTYVTSRANSGGRIGHQLKDLLTGLIVSKWFGLRLVYTPLNNEKWDKFFGFSGIAGDLGDSKPDWVRERSIEKPRRWEGIDFDEIVDFVRLESRPDARTLLVFEQAARVQLYQIYLWQRQGRIKHDVYSEVIRVLRECYHAATHPEKQPFEDPTKVNIVVHIRRGDASKENHRWLPSSFYRNVITQLQERGQNSEIVFHVHSAGTDGQMQEIREELHGCAPSIQFYLNTSPFQAFHQMVIADLLVVSHSSFSDWAGYLSTSPKLIHPHFHMTNLDEREWGRMDRKGDIVGELEDFRARSSGQIPKRVTNDVRVSANSSKPAEKAKVNLFDRCFVRPRKSCHIEWVRDQKNWDGITVFTDEYIGSDLPNQVCSDFKIGWLVEPKVIHRNMYDSVTHRLNAFDLVLTHDSELIQKWPNKCRFAPSARCWIEDANARLHSKAKLLSMIYSSKRGLPGYQLRHQVADGIAKVDLYGRGSDRPIEHKEEGLVNYMFSIAIENSQATNYFTEKILDCMAVGTIPIYWGCPNIDDFFDPDGVVVFNTYEELPSIISKLSPEFYLSRLGAVARNLDLSREFRWPEDWVYENILVPEGVIKD